jgi:hypothetical protein
MITIRKKETAIAGAPAPASGDTLPPTHQLCLPAIQNYHRRTSQVADDNIFPN